MSDPEAPPPEAPLAAIDSAVCPQCETTLRNVVPGADGKTKCLNCGKRFAVHAAIEQAPLTGSFSDDPPSAREPAGGGFALVTVCASVLLLASVVGALAFGVFAIPEIFRYGRLEVEGCWGLLYWPGGVILAWGLWALARSLGPLDAALVHLAWRKGQLQGSLPRPVGSNLPFILPPSVAGGVGGLMVAFAGFEAEEFLVVIGGLLLAGAGMLVGLLCENLNLFLFRLRILALRLNGRHGRSHICPILESPSAIGGMLVFGGAALFTVSLLVDRWYWFSRNNEELLPPVLFLFAFVALGFGAALLGRAFDAALSECAYAGLRQPPQSAWAATISRIALAAFPAGLLVNFGAWLNENNVDFDEFLLTFSLDLAFGGLAFLFWIALKRLHAGRRGLETLLLGSTRNAQRARNAGPAQESWGIYLLFGTGCACALLGFLTFLKLLFGFSRINDFEELLMIVFGFNLFVMLGSYPFVWLGAAVYEVRSMQSAADAARRALNVEPQHSAPAPEPDSAPSSASHA
ncbi:MAG: hypothetical protein HS116_20805 [Planctomycetes bacterium]|nr:hypothetical protein [Planctomycetota bacterium]